jgi:uncharacterized damage-inducible protein DinB
LDHADNSIGSELAHVTAAEFAIYFRHLAARVERAALAVNEDQLWTRPFPFGNSIGHLVLHITGNLNHYIGSLVAGSGYVRNREHEFTDPAGYPREEMLARFQQAIDMVAKALESQDDEAFLTRVPDQPPIQTRLGLFLVCAAHMNNHIGQMIYLVQALKTSTGEPPVW